MPELSILISSHNEGDLLWKTVASCQETCEGIDYEIVVADDASTDDCISLLSERFPNVRVCRSADRQGVSPTRNLAVQNARAEWLVFLDAHCKPEIGAIPQLLQGLKELNGDAMVTPTITPLDPISWTNDLSKPLHGFLVELDTMSCRWVAIETMRPRGGYLESPTLIACCFGIPRQLYERIWGFDPNMYMFGSEDIDMGIRSWLLGHPVLHSPGAVIGHRFQGASVKYSIPTEHYIANQLRMAYKLLTPSLWREWLTKFRQSTNQTAWYRAWDVFNAHRGTAEAGRVHIKQHQQFDIVTYARRFGLAWPLHHQADPALRPPRFWPVDSWNSTNHSPERANRIPV